MPPRLLFLPLALMALGCSAAVADEDDCTPAPLFEACQADESLCGEISSSSVCDETKADGNTRGGIPVWWFERAGACYAEQDYACVKRYFGILAWGGWLKGYTYASEAMSKFLDCETETLEIPEATLKDNWERNAYSHYRDVVSLESALTASEADLFEEAELVRANLDIGESIEILLSSHLTASGNEDVRKTLGRFHIQGQALLTRVDSSRIDYAISYEVQDHYDWHPQRVASTGQSYEEAFPYHAWAGTLVELGLACEFEMHAAWTDTGTLYL